MENLLNENILKGKWKEIKGEVQKLWGRLTDDEIEQAKGEAKTLSGLVQRKYGIKEEEFHQKMNEAISKYVQTDSSKTVEDKVDDKKEINL